MQTRGSKTTVSIQPQQPVLPRRNPWLARRRKHAWLPWLVAGGVFVAASVMLLAVLGLVGALYLSQDRIPSGVTAAGIHIGGKSAEDAAVYLQLNLANQMLTTIDGERSWVVPLADLGIAVDVAATIATAQEADAQSDVPLRYTVELVQAQMGLVSLSEQVNIDAVPGDPPQIGRAMEIPVTLDRLRVDVAGEVGDGVLELDMIEVEPPEPEPITPQYTGPTSTHIVEQGQELALIAREYGVAMEDIVALNGLTDPDLLWIGQELTIPAAGVYSPSAVDAPPAPTRSGKAIVVSIGEQRIYAYENGQLIRSHLTSTGRTVTPTVMGDYSIYVKYVADDMTGPDYFLPQVPYVMYFYSGYGIHGTYWHNSFGRPMSHGCVNLPVDEAQWFFNWAEVGTPVRVIA